MSLPRSHPPLKWMKNFKAVAIDYEYYLTLSDQPQSVCLTERQMYVLSVQNSYTYWLTRWYNTDDITQKTVEFIAAEIESLLMCGCGVPQPTITDTINGNTYITNTTTIYNNTYNTWNTAGQTVASIAPDLDYSTGDPADIDKLMCLGLQMFLTAIVEQAKAIKAGTLDDSKDLIKQLAAVFGALGVAGGAASAAGVTTGVLGFLAGPWVLLGLALAGVGLLVANIVFPMDLSVFTDEEAFEEVYCTMVTNMVGVTPTRDIFQGALEPNDFVPGSNAAQLASVIQPYLDNLDSYLQFLVAMQELYAVADFGLLPDCGCLPPPDPNCVDFTVEEGLWAVEGGNGTWYDGEGYGGLHYPGFGVYILHVLRGEQDGGISKVVVTFNAAQNDVTLSSGDGSNSLHYTGPDATEIEFSATTFPGTWADMNAALGVRVRTNMFGDQAASRLVEACVYPVE